MKAQAAWDLGRLGSRSVLFRAQLQARGIPNWTAVCDGRLPYLHTRGEVALGRRFAIRSKLVRVEFGAGVGGRLEIGDGVFFNSGVSVVANRSIVIGDDCLLGDNVCLYDSNYHQVDEGRSVVTAPVVCERNVWIGRGSIVLPGVTIGENSVVAAMSVVTKSVAANTIVAGNPAVPIGSLSGGRWKRH